MHDSSIFSGIDVPAALHGCALLINASSSS
jgi:hypothetical protein